MGKDFIIASGMLHYNSGFAFNRVDEDVYKRQVTYIVSLDLDGKRLEVHIIFDAFRGLVFLKIGKIGVYN